MSRDLPTPDLRCTRGSQAWAGAVLGAGMPSYVVIAKPEQPSSDGRPRVPG